MTIRAITWVGFAVAAATLGLSAARANTPDDHAAASNAQAASIVVAKNGADNAAGDRGGRGGQRGEGVNHAGLVTGAPTLLARNDRNDNDGVGHEAGEHANGHEAGEHGGAAAGQGSSGSGQSGGGRGGEGHGGGHSGEGGGHR